MEKTSEIRKNLKQREHLENLIYEMKECIIETQKKIAKYENTIDKLNYDLFHWDDFIEKENQDLWR